MRGLLFFIKFLLYSFLTISYAQSIAVNPTGSPESSMNAEDLTVDVLIDGGPVLKLQIFRSKKIPLLNILLPTGVGVTLKRALQLFRSREELF